jgi:8-oxo-dGTP diphosphatase
VSKRRITVVSAAIVRDGRYLITQRLDKAVLPGLWEFPGGKVEEGESDEVALQRELQHRLGVTAGVGERLAVNEQEYPNYIVELHLYRCDLADAEPQPVNVKDMRWVTSSDFDGYDFTPADEQSMDALLFGK